MGSLQKNLHVSAQIENNSLIFLCLDINLLLSLKHIFRTQYNTLIIMPVFVYIIANLCFLNDFLLQILKFVKIHIDQNI